MMSAYELYQTLSGEKWWASQSRAMRWIAARFYAGVESLDELLDRAKPHMVSTHYGQDYCSKPELSQSQVDEIIMLR